MTHITTPNPWTQPAVLRLGAPDIGVSSYAEAWCAYENGVVFCAYDHWDDLWVERDPPMFQRPAHLDPTEITAWSVGREPVEAFYIAKLVSDGYADNEAEARTLLAGGAK